MKNRYITSAASGRSPEGALNVAVQWFSIVQRGIGVESTGLIIAIVGGCLVLTAVFPNFSSQENLRAVLQNLVVMTVYALSQMVALAVGQLNLAVGAIGGLSSVVLGLSLQSGGLSLPVAVALVLLLGLVCGLVNGILIGYTGISGFIITLAAMMLFNGISMGVTRGVPIYGLSPALLRFGFGQWGVVPYSFVVPVVVSLVLALILRRTLMGRHILAVGGNPNAAELYGYSQRTAIIYAHTLSGVLASIAGILATAQLGAALPIIGSDWLLMSFAGPVLGGTSLTGGHVSVLGTILGVILVVLIGDAIILANVNPYWRDLTLGVIILGAASLAIRRRLSGRT